MAGFSSATRQTEAHVRNDDRQRHRRAGPPRFFMAASILLLLAMIYQTIMTPPVASSRASASASATAVGKLQVAAALAATTTINVAYQQSYSLIDNVSNEEWEQIRQKVHSRSLYENPSNPLEKVQNSSHWIAHNIFPNFDCPNIVELGGAGVDGSKFVCHPDRLIHDDDTTKKKECLVYSIGCAGNYKFEDALVELHNGKCEIHVFDPAPKWERPNDVAHRNIHYHAWGFVSSYDKESKSNVWPAGRQGGFRTFEETLKELGHENRIIDIFKIDCEGCEWSTYRDWIGKGFRQILVENHGVPTPKGRQKSQWFQKPLNIYEYYEEYRKNGYALFHRDFHGRAVDLAFIKLHPEFWENNKNGSHHRWTSIHHDVSVRET